MANLWTRSSWTTPLHPSSYRSGFDYKACHRNRQFWLIGSLQNEERFQIGFALLFAASVAQVILVLWFDISDCSDGILLIALRGLFIAMLLILLRDSVHALSTTLGYATSADAWQTRVPSTVSRTISGAWLLRHTISNTAREIQRQLRARDLRRNPQLRGPGHLAGDAEPLLRNVDMDCKTISEFQGDIPPTLVNTMETCMTACGYS